MQVQGVQPSRGPAEDRRRGPRAAEVTRRPLGKRLRTFDRVLAAPSGFESQQRGAFPAVSGAKEVPLAGAIPVIALASAPTINNNPAEAGVCVQRCVAERSASQTATRYYSCCSRRAAQCTASFFAAATVFFGSVSSSTPSLYLAWAV